MSVQTPACREMDEGWSITRRLSSAVSRSEISHYSGASGDVNRVHTDEPYAIEVAGQPSVIAHGMLIMGLTGTFLEAVVGRGSVRTFGGRFVAQVFPGDSLDCTIEVHTSSVTRGGREIALDLLTCKGDGSTVFMGRATAVITQDIP